MGSSALPRRLFLRHIYMLLQEELFCFEERRRRVNFRFIIMRKGITRTIPTMETQAQLHYDGSLNPSYLKPLKKKSEVTNIQYGRTLPTFTVEPQEESVEKPKDMTRQIPRFNVGTPMDYDSQFRVATIKTNTNHVPRRKPVVIHGVNSLANSQAGIVQGEAEFFGDQQGVKALRDTLNYDPMDQIQKDMLRISKADAVDEVTAKGGLHNTHVKRTRTRRRAGKLYI